MKITDIKFVAGQVLLVAGMVIISIGVRWSFFTGLVLMMVSALFGLRSSWPRSWVGWFFGILRWMACMTFLVWLSAFGTEKPPLAALVGVWIAWSIEEFHTWRQSRRLT